MSKRMHPIHRQLRGHEVFIYIEDGHDSELDVRIVQEIFDHLVELHKKRFEPTRPTLTRVEWIVLGALLVGFSAAVAGILLLLGGR